MNVNIMSVMIEKKNALHQLIWVVERQRREEIHLILSLIVIVMPSITLFVCKSSSLEMYDAKRQFPSLGGLTRVIFICICLDVEMLPPTLGTKVWSVCTWLTKLTFWRIEMAEVCTDPVASSGSYNNSFNRYIAIIRNQRIIVGQISYKC